MTSNIRLRAIRAAQVASLSAGLVSSTACPGTNSPPDAFPNPDTNMNAAIDAFITPDSDRPDAGRIVLGETGVVMDAAADDAGRLVLGETGVVMDAAAGDAGCTTFPPVTETCCLVEGGFWDAASMSCAIITPGPFVPPAMNA